MDFQAKERLLTVYKQSKITKCTNLPSSSISLVILSSSLMAEKSLRAEIAVPAAAPSCSTETKTCYHLISEWSDKDLFSPYTIKIHCGRQALSPAITAPSLLPWRGSRFTWLERLWKNKTQGKLQLGFPLEKKEPYPLLPSCWGNSISTPHRRWHHLWAQGLRGINAHDLLVNKIHGQGKLLRIQATLVCYVTEPP